MISLKIMDGTMRINENGGVVNPTVCCSTLQGIRDGF